MDVEVTAVPVEFPVEFDGVIEETPWDFVEMQPGAKTSIVSIDKANNTFPFFSPVL